MDMEDHVTSRIADGRASMGGGVVEEPEDLIIGLMGGLGLRAASMVGSTNMA